MIFEKHNLVHFLCYGTLWGQIRMSKILPWSAKAEFCVLNNQLSDIDEGHLYSSFQRMFLRLRYFSTDGVYVVQDNHKSHPFIEIYVFERDNTVSDGIMGLIPMIFNYLPLYLQRQHLYQQNMYKRIGWKRRILPPNCDWTPSLDCFPAHLIELPLPERKLGKHMYAVPMGGIEIQKYHYSTNWWKKVETRNCNTNPNSNARN